MNPPARFIRETCPLDNALLAIYYNDFFQGYWTACSSENCRITYSTMRDNQNDPRLIPSDEEIKRYAAETINELLGQEHLNKRGQYGLPGELRKLYLWDFWKRKGSPGIVSNVKGRMEAETDKTIETVVDELHRQGVSREPEGLRSELGCLLYLDGFPENLLELNARRLLLQEFNEYVDKVVETARRNGIMVEYGGKRELPFLK